ncbi:hypothetical protein KUCAC02_030124 [Chaenocephalus aceratus]|uniref:Uncharacterized protein n=1 Tax=Chaenocephalus aceratus TaxID=36190 RepID=A0ACB9XHU8_CHAAC|nr:hypothetical protein KUCAC02_030124 [Chaenocephalus aceratus]
MDGKLDCLSLNGKMEDVNEVKPNICDSPADASECPILPDDSIADTNLHKNPKGGESVDVFPCSSVEPPQPLCAARPSSMEACTVQEMSQTFTSISRSQDSLKTTTTVHTEPGADDLCAAFLLSCLFCHPLDCFLAVMRGCNGCIWSLCSCLCGCEPSTLQPLLGVTRSGDLCECLGGVRCFLCDCPAYDICLQATECLDLAMEISQMLYH